VTFEVLTVLKVEVMVSGLLHNSPENHDFSLLASNRASVSFFMVFLFLSNILTWSA